MQKILFVDDDVKFQSVIAEVLKLEGYQVDLANDVSDGLALFKQNVYDLVISDIKMKDIDGLQFLQILRKLDQSVRFILLTGSNDEDDEIRGLELQASDFIKKPVSIRVLLTRIERALRKNKFAIEAEAQFLESKSQRLMVDIPNRKVFKNDKAVEVTMLEFNLLVYFLRNKQIVLTRAQIIRDVWKVNELSLDIRNVDTHIKRLRTKLELSSIYSIRGVGYEWSE